MRDYIINAISSGTAKLLIGWPVGILMIRTAVWCGWFEWAKMPNPTMRQSVIAAWLIVFVA